jgi:uncharacterized membrane protein
MTNTTTTTTGRTDTGVPTTYNVIAVSFDVDVNAYGALTKLKELDSQGQLHVHEAVAAERAADGAITVKDRVGSVDMAGTAGGGLTGLLVGVLGGPVGVLIGGSTGLLIGSLVDLDDAEQIDTALGQLSQSIKPGRTAVLAVVTEPSGEVADAAMASFGGTVLRRSVSDVEAEVAAVEKAEREAARAAQLELMRSRRDRSRDAAHARVEGLKAKFGRHDDATASAKPTEDLR